MQAAAAKARTIITDEGFDLKNIRGSLAFTCSLNAIAWGEQVSCYLLLAARYSLAIPPYPAALLSTITLCPLPNTHHYYLTTSILPHPLLSYLLTYYLLLNVLLTLDYLLLNVLLTIDY